MLNLTGALFIRRLAGIYHDDEVDAIKALATGETVTQELDKMLEKAKIGPELIESWERVAKPDRYHFETFDVSNASAGKRTICEYMKKATESASILSDSYQKTAKTLDQNVSCFTGTAATISDRLQKCCHPFKRICPGFRIPEK